MRRLPLVLAVGVLAAALPAVVRAGDAPKPELPTPPTTPLPKYGNPLFDAVVGETCFYAVREVGVADGWVLYFEERVLARTATKVLVETVKTDETNTKDFGIDNTATRWRDVAEEVPLPPAWHFLPEKDKEEIVYTGKPGAPPTKAVRSVHRTIEFPEEPDKPNSPKKTWEIWFSHDVAVQGRAKMIPAQNQGERVAISWDKKLPAEECAKPAARYPDDDKKAGAPPSGGSGMGEPAMGEPAMGDPGMGEPPMGEPSMGEPSMG